MGSSVDVRMIMHIHCRVHDAIGQLLHVFAKTKKGSRGVVRGCGGKCGGMGHRGGYASLGLWRGCVMRGDRGVVGAASGHRTGCGATHRVCVNRVGHTVCSAAGPRPPPRRRTSGDTGSDGGCSPLKQKNWNCTCARARDS